MNGISYEFNIVSSSGELSRESYGKIVDYHKEVDRDIRVAEPICVGDIVQISLLEDGVFRAEVIEKVLVIDNCDKSEYITRYGVSLNVIGQKESDVIYGNFISNMDGISNEKQD
jgi:hypothetical protein